MLRSPAPVSTAPLQLTEVPTPAPAGDQVLIRISACAICRTDLHVVEGDLPPRKSPVIPGHQVVGVVEGGVLAARTRVGVAWLHRTCGACRFCRSGKENLCEKADFTGYTVDGGFAEYIVASAPFVHPIPDGFRDTEAAPLLCAGIIGFRCLRLSGIQRGGRLGIYGFGAAAHLALQVARHWEIAVYVCTRDERHQKLALEMGAHWAGGATAQPPEKLDAAIIFAPAGELVPAALAALDEGATLALGGIHMSTIPPLDYGLLYHERIVRSVANNTRDDARDFLKVAAEIPIRPQVELFPLREANRALDRLKNDAIRGAGVLVVE